MFLVDTLATIAICKFAEHASTIIPAGAKALWRADAVQNIVGRSMVWVKNTATAQARELAREVITKTPNPALEELINRLNALIFKAQEELKKGAEGAPLTIPEDFFSEDEKTTFDDFTKNHKSIIQKARLPDGSLIKFNEELFSELTCILQDDNPNLERFAELASHATQFLKTVQAGQMGIAAQIVGPAAAQQLRDASFATSLTGAVKSALQELNKSSDPATCNLLQALENLVPSAESNKGKEEDNDRFFTQESRDKALQSLIIFTGAKEKSEPFITLERELKENQWNSNSLEQAIELLKALKKNQTGYLEQAKEFLIGGGLEGVLSAMGITSADTAALGKKIRDDSKKAQIEALKRLNKRKTTDEAFPEELELSLSTKIDTMANIAVKRLLTKLIFDTENWKEIFNKIYKEAYEKPEQNVAATTDVEFFSRLESEFTLSDLSNSYINQARKWFYLHIAAPVIKRYVDKAMADIKADLIHFLRQNPTERTRNIFDLIIKPLNSHMTEFSTFVPTLRGKVVDGYDKVIQAHFDAHIDPKLHNFSKAVVEKYAYSISLFNLQSKMQLLLTVASSALTVVSFVFSYRTSLKVISFLASFVLSGAFERMLNMGIKFIAARQVKKIVLKEFFETDQVKSATYSRMQHIINVRLLEELDKFNTGQGRATAPKKLRSSPTTKNEMDVFIRQLLATIPISIATTTTDAFNSHFESSLTGSAKKELFSFINHFTPFISIEILKRMESLLSDERRAGKSLGPLSEFVWSALCSIERSLTTDTNEITQAQIDATETQLVEQLEMAVEKVVLEGVKLALDPSKKLQEEIDASIEELESKTTSLITSFHELSIETFQATHEEYKKVVKSLLEMVTQFKNNSAVQELASMILTSFTNITADMNTSMQTIQVNLDKKKEAHQKLDSLTTIHRRIKGKEGVVTINARGNIDTLHILREKRDLPRVLIDAISLYEDFLKDFRNNGSPSEEFIAIYKTQTSNFLGHLQNVIDQLTREIEDVNSEVNETIARLKEKNPLSSWKAENLKKIIINPSDVASRIAGMVNMVPVEEYAAPTMMYFMMQLIQYKTRPYHWKGILSNVANACAVKA